MLMHFVKSIIFNDWIIISFLHKGSAFLKVLYLEEVLINTDPA